MNTQEVVETLSLSNSTIIMVVAFIVGAIAASFAPIFYGLMAIYALFSVVFTALLIARLVFRTEMQAEITVNEKNSVLKKYSWGYIVNRLGASAAGNIVAFLIFNSLAPIYLFLLTVYNVVVSALFVNNILSKSN